MRRKEGRIYHKIDRSNDNDNDKRYTAIDKQNPLERIDKQNPFERRC